MQNVSETTPGKNVFFLFCVVLFFEPESFLFYVTGDVEAAKITDSSWVITENLKTDLSIQMQTFPQL